MTEERKQSLFLDYIDGTLDAEGMEELHALTEADPSAKEELFSLKEMADMASQDDGMSSFEKDRRAAGLIRAVTGGRTLVGIRIREILRYVAVAAVAAGIGVGGTFLLRRSGAETMTTVEALPGSTTSVTLPDGTAVTLKSASALQYDPAAFASRERTVWLDGEAFFKVVADSMHPFIVRTPHQSVKVLGTTFNVQAFKADSLSTLVLLDGKVSLDLLDPEGKRVHSLEIHPGEKCIYDKTTGRMNVEKISRGETAQDWNSGVCYFRGEPLGRIASRLEQYFKVTIEVDPGLGKEGSYSGAVSLGEGVERILNLLNYDNSFQLVIPEDGYYFLKAEK